LSLLVLLSEEELVKELHREIEEIINNE